VVVTGLLLARAYVGQPAVAVGTAYGLMVLTKVVLLLMALAVALLNFRLVRRRGTPVGTAGLMRLVEVELGLLLTVLLSAAALTSLPPGADVPAAERASAAEVAARFRLGPPRLASPPVDELLRTAEPLMRSTGVRTEVERAWSESNHHWAGLLVLLMGLLALAERAGIGPARHWPLLFLGMAGFLGVRSDPRAWPLGEAGFWESLSVPDVLQHRLFVLLVVAFGVWEWAGRTGRLQHPRWRAVFPVLAAVGGGLLLTHSHAMVGLKDEFLVEVTHTPLGILGVLAGWARWYEVRAAEGSVPASWLWRVCLVAVGALLLAYREG
jgi:putative copper resistance protein D